VVATWILVNPLISVRRGRWIEKMPPQRRGTMRRTDLEPDQVQLRPEKNPIDPHRACLGGIMPGSYTSCPAHLSPFGSRESVGRSGSHQAACHRGNLGGEKNLCRTPISKRRCPTKSLSRNFGGNSECCDYCTTPLLHLGLAPTFRTVSETVIRQ